MSIATSIETASDELVAGFVELSASHYADQPVNDPRVVRWRHLESPNGPSTAVELVDGSKHVGRMWIQVHDWSVRNTPIRAANPIDFLIREDHRTLAAFMTLFRAAMKEAERHAEVVFHTSNPITDELFRKLLKLQPVTELDGALIPVRPFAIAATGKVFDARGLGRLADAAVSWLARLVGGLSRLTGLSLSDQATADEQAGVISQLAHDELVCGARTAAYRRWRYRGAGPISYSQAWIRRRGKVVGYVVTSDRDLEGIKGMFVIDLVMPRGRPLWARALWLQLAGRAARSRRDAVFFFYNRANTRLAALTRFPMVTVARERLPQQVPVFIRAGAADPVPTAFNDVDWARGYYVLADFDLL